MTKDEFLELKNKHSRKNKYKVYDGDELAEIVQKATQIDPTMDLNWLDVSNVENMSGLFYGSDFNGDISEWDVSNVKIMNSMFYDSKFNGDISNWDVGNVEDMYEMFAHSPFNGDLSRWNVSNVVNMQYMFYNTPFNGDIHNWDVSNVERAHEFNPDMDINNERDLRDYIEFLRALHENKQFDKGVKGGWLKTRDIAVPLSNYIADKPEFAEKIKKAVCK